MHPRQGIRDEISSILTAVDWAGLLGYTVNVKNAQILGINDNDLPAISVIYTDNQGGEDVVQEEDTPGDNNLERRQLIISVEVMAMLDDQKATADQADDISEVVEDTMAKNITLNEKADSTEFYRVRFGSNPDGSKPARLVENLFRVHYQTIKAGA